MKLEVTFVEHVTYTHVFDVPDDGSLGDEMLGDVQEVLDLSNAWDQLSEEDWMGGDVTHREIIDFKEVA